MQKEDIDGEIGRYRESKGENPSEKDITNFAYHERYVKNKKKTKK